MSRNIVVSFAGQEGTNPPIYKMDTSDTYEIITQPGYLNSNTGYNFKNNSFLLTTYNDGSGGQVSEQFVINVGPTGLVTLQKAQGEGDVSGPPSSYDSAVALFVGTSGNQLKTVDFFPQQKSLFGFNETSTPDNILIGTGLQIVEGQLIATGTGAGDVTGPESSATGSLTVFKDTTGKLIGEPAFTPAGNSLIGYGASTSEVINITAGPNIVISDGVIEAVGSGMGDVTGPNGAIPTLCQFSDTTGKVIKQSAVNLINDTLVGFFNGDFINVSAGSNVTISEGIISATGSGTGNVTGPVSSTLNSFALWANTEGTLLKSQTFSTSPNTIIGYDNSSAPALITVGTGLSLTGNVLSATASGSGNVTGPGSSVDGSFALYSGTTGKLLTNIAFSPTQNSLVGYDNASKVSNVSIGTGLVLSGNILSIPASGVTPATYTYMTASINAQGRITAAASGTPPVTAVTAASPIVSSGGQTPIIAIQPSGVSAGTYNIGNGQFTVSNYGLVTFAVTPTNLVTSVTAAAPLASSGGTTPVVSLNNSGVVAGNYTYGNGGFTVNAQGLVTSATSSTSSGTVTQINTDQSLMVNGAAGGTLTTTGTLSLNDSWMVYDITNRNMQIAEGTIAPSVINALSIGLNAKAGNNSVAIGGSAGQGTTGHQSAIFIGSGADASTDNLTRPMAIGVGARVSVDDGLILGTETTKVGIRTQAPSVPLHVLGQTNFNDYKIGLASQFDSGLNIKQFFNIAINAADIQLFSIKLQTGYKTGSVIFVRVDLTAIVESANYAAYGSSIVGARIVNTVGNAIAIDTLPTITLTKDSSFPAGFTFYWTVFDDNIELRATGVDTYTIDTFGTYQYFSGIAATEI